MKRWLSDRRLNALLMLSIVIVGWSGTQLEARGDDEPRIQQVVSELEAASATDFDAHERAYRQLVRIGPTAMEAVGALLKSDKGHVRRAAIHWVSCMGRPAHKLAPSIASAVTRCSDFERVRVIEAFERFGLSGRIAAPEIRALRLCADQSIRDVAAQLLQIIGDKSPEECSVDLLRGLESNEDSVRESCLRELALQAEPSAVVATALARHLADQSAQVRRVAFTFISEHSPLSVSTLAAVMSAVEGERDLLAFQAGIGALPAIGGTEAVDLACTMLSSTSLPSGATLASDVSVGIIEEAIRGLSRMRGVAVGRLHDLLRSTSGDLRARAALALGRMGEDCPRDSVHQLISLLRDDTPCAVPGSAMGRQPQTMMETTVSAVAQAALLDVGAMAIPELKQLEKRSVDAREREVIRHQLDRMKYSR
jgi:HEAT repeat protein